MNQNDINQFASRISFVIRWILGLVFLFVAYTYPDAIVLYFFGAALLVSGFFQPKRCTNQTCEHS